MKEKGQISYRNVFDMDTHRDFTIFLGLAEHWQHPRAAALTLVKDVVKRVDETI